MKPAGFLFPLIAAGVTIGLNGCAVGPNYHAPRPPAAGFAAGGAPVATVQAGGGVQYFASGADISGEWWTLFQSPELNSLIDTALARNPTLAAAQQTLINAEETVRAEQGNFLPSISGTFQAERERVSSASAASFGGAAASTVPTTTAGGTTTGSTTTVTSLSGGGSIPPFSIFNTTLNLSYSPDVFGGVRRQVESLAAQAEYERYELEASYLTLTTNIVTTAVLEASLTGQIAATQQIITVEQRQLKILNDQFNLGGVPKADVLNEQATLANTLASLPRLQLQLAQARNQLADYVGAFPSDFHEADFTLASLHLPNELPVSLASALVGQRPDIAASAAQLHEASANLGIATANMLPQITLTAAVGHEALSSGTLFTPQTLVWSLIAGITQPLFEGGTLSARRKAALALLRGSADQYQVTVLSAFQNVANALQALQFDALTLQAAQAAADAASQSLTVTQNQYKLGGQPITAVLTAQTTYQNAILAVARAAASRLSDTAGLFQSLGGGWWHRADVSGAAQNCCGIIP